MAHRNLEASRAALVAVKGIVGDTLFAHQKHRPQIMQLTRLDLACDLKGLQHAQLCHYLRCDATREVLLLIRESIEELFQLLDDGDDEAEATLEMAEPFRHHLYTSVTIAALRAAERASIKREIEYWRRRNALKIAPAYEEV